MFVLMFAIQFCTYTCYSRLPCALCVCVCDEHINRQLEKRRHGICISFLSRQVYVHTSETMIASPPLSPYSHTQGKGGEHRPPQSHTKACTLTECTLTECTLTECTLTECILWWGVLCQLIRGCVFRDLETVERWQSGKLGEDKSRD
eukprot:GHVS01015527.1.p1 GENE.GHVS01015527.1~~GHVS01015527.1.p1  ORF type:complete len:147 (-),score=12.66 GHVS01015527.1:221-661(-)